MTQPTLANRCPGSNRGIPGNLVRYPAALLRNRQALCDKRDGKRQRFGTKDQTPVKAMLTRWRWTCLLLMLLAALFQSAASAGSEAGAIVTIPLYVLVFIGTLYAAEVRAPFKLIGILLVLLWFALGVASEVAGILYAGTFFVFVSSCILVGVLIVTVTELAHNRDAGLDSILGAVFGYLLIAVAWSLMYLRIEIETPGAFRFPDEKMTASGFVYYSLVTQTSLGYGEITPARPTPRLLAGLQATFGTIYIAVFIGRIVARFKD